MQSNRVLSTMHRIASLLQAASAADGGASEWMKKKAVEIRKFIQDGKTATIYVNYYYNPRTGYNNLPKAEGDFISDIGTQYASLENIFSSADRPKPYSEADKELLTQLIAEAKEAQEKTEKPNDPNFRFLTRLGSLVTTLERERTA